MPAPKKVLRLAAYSAGGVLLGLASLLAGLWVLLPDPAPLARENPSTTALIEQRRAEARARKAPFRPRQSWVPLDRISPTLVQAVLVSEDASFFGHDGIDWVAVRDAARHDLEVGRFARGASTLTQQLAKNLWLGTDRSLWRKLKEAVLAVKLERALSKRRILTLYANVVEMDEGVFGFEAGARHRFGTSAASLTTAQAAVLASLLPAPRRVDLDRPSRWLGVRARRLLDRLRDAGRIDADEHLRASTELERILAGPAPADDADEPPEEDAPALDGEASLAGQSPGAPAGDGDPPREVVSPAPNGEADAPAPGGEAGVEGPPGDPARRGAPPKPDGSST